MYKCEQCGKSTKHKQIQLKKIEYRQKVYYHRDKDEPTYGSEIVKEIKLCPSCKEKVC